jgi:hypothetical protein
MLSLLSLLALKALAQPFPTNLFNRSDAMNGTIGKQSGTVVTVSNLPDVKR